MIKIGVISDTHVHSFCDLPKKLIDGLKDVELILHAGDLDTLNVLEGLKTIVPEVKAVWGNMDPPKVKKALPEVEIIKIGKFNIGLTHGYGAPFSLKEAVRAKFKNKSVDCIVYGHSHSPYNKIEEGILFFNPGSPIDKFFVPYNSYGILEIDTEIKGKIIRL